jgi:hypothetical protein
MATTAGQHLAPLAAHTVPFAAISTCIHVGNQQVHRHSSAGSSAVADATNDTPPLPAIVPFMTAPQACAGPHGASSPGGPPWAPTGGGYHYSRQRRLVSLLKRSLAAGVLRPAALGAAPAAAAAATTPRRRRLLGGDTVVPLLPAPPGGDGTQSLGQLWSWDPWQQQPHASETAAAQQLPQGALPSIPEFTDSLWPPLAADDGPHQASVDALCFTQLAAGGAAPLGEPSTAHSASDSRLPHDQSHPSVPEALWLPQTPKHGPVPAGRRHRTGHSRLGLACNAAGGGCAPATEAPSSPGFGMSWYVSLYSNRWVMVVRWQQTACTAHSDCTCVCTWVWVAAGCALCCAPILL